MSTGVYKWTCTVNGKVYVGSAATSLRQRRHDHRKLLRYNKHSNQHLQRAWNKYGEENFVFATIERCLPELCLGREQHWIDYYRSYDRRYGYNISPTAGSCLGTRMSEEWKAEQKRKNALLTPEQRAWKFRNRRRPTEEHIAKLKVARVGKKHTDASKEKMRQAKLGKKQTPEHIAKVKAAKAGYRHPEHVKEKIRETHRQKWKKAEYTPTPPKMRIM
jgi:group I intron endonuclease